MSNIKALGPVVSDQKIFFMFSLYKTYDIKHVTPGRGFFWPQNIILTKMVVLYVGLLDDATNQISRLWFQTRLAHVTLICNGLEPFEQLFKRAIYGSFLPSFVKIQPEVLEEMSFEAIDATDNFSLFDLILYAPSTIF